MSGGVRGDWIVDYSAPVALRFVEFRWSESEIEPSEVYHKYAVFPVLFEFDWGVVSEQLGEWKGRHLTATSCLIGLVRVMKVRKVVVEGRRLGGRPHLFP